MGLLTWLLDAVVVVVAVVVDSLDDLKPVFLSRVDDREDVVELWRLHPGLDDLQDEVSADGVDVELDNLGVGGAVGVLVEFLYQLGRVSFSMLAWTLFW